MGSRRRKGAEGPESKLGQAFEREGFVHSGQQGPIVFFTKKI
jgi:hypothetical protein